MATLITKNSSTASSVPTAAQLVQGELAVNVTDKRLFTENASGSVVELGTNPSTLALPNGTANGVAYLNGSKVLTTGSALIFTGTNLGVGVNPTNARLEVNASSGEVFRADASGGAFRIVANQTDILLQGSSSIQSWINGSEQMRLTSTGLDVKGKLGVGYSDFSGLPTNGAAFAGSVGIGTSSPGARLHVDSGATGLMGILNSTNANGGYITGQSSGSAIWDFGSAKQVVNTGGASDVALSSRSGFLAFGTGNTERMRLDSSGNLGLGVTPSAWFSANKVIDMGTRTALWSGGAGQPNLGYNCYVNTSGNFIYKASDVANYYSQDGAHKWFNAASGSAGNAISFTQAMTLDASGNLGLGTTSISYPLSLRKDPTSSSAAMMLIDPSTRSNSASIQINNNGSGTFNVGRADSAGNGHGGASALGAYDTFIWNTGVQNMVFGTYNIERARIDSSGIFMVGRTASSATTVGFQVGGDGYVNAAQSASTNSSTTMEVYSTGAGAYRFYVGLGGTVYATSTTISAISDIRFKENVRDLDAGLAEVMALKPRLYDWKEGKGANTKNARGFIAQEFEQVFPDLIDEWKDPAPEGEEPYKSVRQDLIPVLVKAIQEQQAIINTLTARVAALESK